MVMTYNARGVPRISIGNFYEGNESNRIDDHPAGIYYSFTSKSHMSSHEVTLYCKNDGTWFGDVVEYGEWRDLDPDEIEDYKETLKKLLIFGEDS